MKRPLPEQLPGIRSNCKDGAASPLTATEGCCTECWRRFDFTIPEEYSEFHFGHDCEAQ